VIEVADLALRHAKTAEASELDMLAVAMLDAASPVALVDGPDTEPGAQQESLGLLDTMPDPPQKPVRLEPPLLGADQPLPSCLPDYLDAVERDIIQRALAQTQFNRTQAAELLGISFRQLRYQMQRLNIQAPE
jgi:two-component system, NtrC family, response regulator PilR